MANENPINHGFDVSSTSLRKELTDRFIPALLFVQGILLLLGFIGVSAAISSRETMELHLSAAKIVELYGTLARYGDVRYARLVVVSGMGPNKFEKFEVYDIYGEPIQESDPKEVQKVSKPIVDAARKRASETAHSGEMKTILLEKKSVEDRVVFSYLVITSDGSQYIVVLTMSKKSFPWAWIIVVLCLGLALSYYIAKYIAKTRISLTVTRIEAYSENGRKINSSGSVLFAVPYKEFVPVHSAILEMIQNINEQSKQVAIARISQMLSHDMRAPLGTFERLILLPDSALSSMRGAIRDSLNRLYSMVEALRNSESEHLVQRTPSRLDFSFGYENLLHKSESRKVVVEVPKNPSEELSIDAIKFERSWLNLASNAIEVARLLVKIEYEVEDGNLILRVIDDGPGIPEEFLPRLFQRGATHGKPDGTGLGLAYVRQIMRGHGGDVTYRRENGLTIFECYLPNAVVKNQEDSVQSQLTSTVAKAVKVEHVGICFVPKSMADSLCTELASHVSVKFSFTTEYEGADIVATNDPDLALTAIEEGKPFKSSCSLMT